MPTDDPMLADGPLSPRERAFVRAYVADPARNATAAARAAGYAEGSSAEVTASRLLSRDKVRDAIAEVERQAAERAGVSIDLVVSQWVDVAFADPRELSEVVVDACRHCHGDGHAYQWRTPLEFDQAHATWVRAHGRDPVKAGPEPDDVGGYGFRATVAPHPDCPACDGRGLTSVVLKDQRTLSRRAVALLAGVRQTQHGIEVRTQDQGAALERLARYAGAFKEDNEQRSSGLAALAGLVERINTTGSRAQLARDGGEA